MPCRPPDDGSRTGWRRARTWRTSALGSSRRHAHRPRSAALACRRRRTSLFAASRTSGSRIIGREDRFRPRRRGLRVALVTGVDAPDDAPSATWRALGQKPCDITVERGNLFSSEKRHGMAPVAAQGAKKQRLAARLRQAAEAFQLKFSLLHVLGLFRRGAGVKRGSRATRAAGLPRTTSAVASRSAID